MANILLADDEKDVVTLIKFLLERDGHHITEAFDGAQVLAQLGIDPPATPTLPDLLILDVMMPRVDGYTVSRRLMEQEHTRRLPVLVLTARGQMKDLFQAVTNVSSYLEKPFDPAKLRETVSAILKKKA